MTEKAGPMSRVVMERHLTHRRHSTWTADVPLELVVDAHYFDAEGNATPDFDLWMQEHGEESDIDYTADGNPDVEDLSFEVIRIDGVVWHAMPVDRDPGVIYADSPVGKQLLRAAAGLWSGDVMPDWRENEYSRGQVELLMDTVRVFAGEEDLDGEAVKDRILGLVRAAGRGEL
jgi:hypothetical protein